MADLLTVTTGTVDCRLVVATNDSTDQAQSFDTIAPQGFVYLTPRRNAFPAKGEPAIVVPDTISLAVNEDGWATMPTELGEATGQTVIELPVAEGMTWQVSFDLWLPPYPWQGNTKKNRLRIDPFDVPVEAGKHTHIADYLPLGADPSKGTVWVKGDRGPGVVGAIEVDGALVLETEDGSLLDPVPLPASSVPGPASNLAIGTVTAGTSESDFSASITGTKPEFKLNLRLPRGLKGNDGAGIPTGGTAGQVPARTADGGSVWANVKDLIPDATPTTPGIMSAADKVKLDAAATVDVVAAKYVGKDAKVVNVKDYGAKGDGVADDTAAFVSAAAATSTTDADALTIVVPPGEYVLSDRWRLRPNTTVSAYGATIHRSGGIGMIVCNWPAEAEGTEGTGKVGGYSGWSNITVLGLTLDGHGDTNTATTNLVCMEHAKRITIRDLTCRRNVGHHGLELNAIDGFTVENFRSEGYLPVSGLTEKEAFQIDCAAPGNAGIADETPCKNGTVNGVYVGGYGTLGAHQVAIGSHTRPTSGFYENITIRGVVAEAPQYAGVMAFGWSNCTISAPVVRTPGAFGVRVTESRDLIISAPTVTAPGTQAVSISVNSLRIQVTGGSLTGGATGVYVGNGCVGCSIVGVTTNATTGPGITVDGTALNTNVQGNTILGAGSSTANTTLGAIRAAGTATRTSISGNKCVPHGNSSWFTVPAGISAAATTVETWAVGNDLKGYPAATSGTVDTTLNRV